MIATSIIAHPDKTSVHIRQSELVKVSVIMLRSYSSWASRTLQPKVRHYHQVSNINFNTTSRIINLGIRTWRPYRLSRRGQAILDQIHRTTSKVTDVFTGSHRSQTRGILLENLKQFNRTAEYQRLLNLSLVDARSVRNKCDQVNCICQTMT